MTDDRRHADVLLDQALRGRITRRDMLKRAALLGLSAPTIAALLAACGGGGENNGTSTTTTGGTTSTATTSTGGGAASPAATSASTPAGSPSSSPSASPSAGGATGSPAATTSYSKDTAPAVPQPDLGKKYSGQKITYYGDAVGQGNEIDKVLAAQFTKDTGIEVNVVPRPKDSTESYAQYQRFFQGKSADMDVGMFDVIWPGAFAPHLVDLNQALANEAKLHYETIIQNDTVDGKLVAMPWFADFGILYYRTDLLDKNGFSAPPKTWDELEQQAKKIMDGEKGANPNFAGFVFQGKAYEGLTCDGLEWIASTGGGTLVDNSGKVTLNNPDAIAMLNRTRAWVADGIAPRGVTSYEEEDARNAFQGGNAAFMRNWPYAYAAGNLADSPIKGKFDVAPLPASSGQKSYGTVGGWQLGVSNYSKAKEASIEFVRYMTSPEVETWRAVIGSYVPTIPSVASKPEVLQAMPFLKTTQDVVRVTRPSTAAGEKYNQVSTAFFQGVNQILNGQDASSMVPQIAQQMQRAMG